MRVRGTSSNRTVGGPGRASLGPFGRLPAGHARRLEERSPLSRVLGGASEGLPTVAWLQPASAVTKGTPVSIAPRSNSPSAPGGIRARNTRRTMTPPVTTGGSLAFGGRPCKPLAVRSSLGGRRGDDWAALAENPPADRLRANRRRTLDHTNRQPRPAQPSIEPVGIAGHLDPLDTAGSA
jgi:hypothetical protein